MTVFDLEKGIITIDGKTIEQIVGDALLKYGTKN